MALLFVKVEWRSVSVVYGAQCVMTCGVRQMLGLSVGNWDSLLQVVGTIKNDHFHPYTEVKI